MFLLPFELIQEIESELDTKVTVKPEELYICFSTFSPAGQDCEIELDFEEDDDLHALPEKLREYYNGFDVSEETYLWLDDTGHGKNGAPYELEDVLEDMKWQEQWILDLCKLIEGWNFENNYSCDGLNESCLQEVPYSEVNWFASNLGFCNKCYNRLYRSGISEKVLNYCYELCESGDDEAANTICELTR